MQEEIGKTAGAIWDALNTKGEQSLSELKKAVKGKEPTIDWAIGWLARENQIVTWVSMEEGFFLYRVALDAADIAPGHIQGSTPVVANLANPRLAVWDLAAVPTGKTPHPVAVALFVQFALANVFMNDFVERTHWCQAQCRGKR